MAGKADGLCELLVGECIGCIDSAKGPVSEYLSKGTTVICLTGI